MPLVDYKMEYLACMYLRCRLSQSRTLSKARYSPWENTGTVTDWEKTIYISGSLLGIDSLNITYTWVDLSAKCKLFLPPLFIFICWAGIVESMQIQCLHAATPQMTWVWLVILINIHMPTLLTSSIPRKASGVGGIPDQVWISTRQNWIFFWQNFFDYINQSHLLCSIKVLCCCQETRIPIPILTHLVELGQCPNL